MCVLVHDEESGTHFVRGLCVKAQHAYCVPSDELMNVDAQAFIKVHKCSKTFEVLAGMRLHYNQWMEQLEAIRNNACSEAVDSLRGPLGMCMNPTIRGAPMTLRSKCAELPHDVKLPKTVDMMFPPDVEGAQPFCLVAAFAIEKRSAVHVRMDVSSLRYIAENLRASGSSTKFKRSPVVHTFAHDEIKWCNQKKRLFMYYRDVDGRTHRKFGKIRDSAGDDDYNAAVVEASSRLHVQYIQLHVPAEASDVGGANPDAENGDMSDVVEDADDEPNTVNDQHVDDDPHVAANISDAEA